MVLMQISQHPDYPTPPTPTSSHILVGENSLKFQPPVEKINSEMFTLESLLSAKGPKPEFLLVGA